MKLFFELFSIFTLAFAVRKLTTSKAKYKAEPKAMEGYIFFCDSLEERMYEYAKEIEKGQRTKKHQAR